MLLINRNISSNYKISTIESFTGGLFSSKMISNSGASKWFVGSLVLYRDEAKEIFGIDTSKGVVNKEIAIQMNNICREKFKSDFSISFTGNAGPTSLENKQKGLVYIAINDEVFKFKLKGSRKKIQKLAVKKTIKILFDKKIIFYI